MKIRPRPVLSSVFLAVLVCAALIPVPAYAWKPTTHVYLAELALQDALDDGRLTIYMTDYAHGRVLTDASGNPLVLGTYPVDPQILQALRQYPEQFRAGVLGPDAFPDILTGQQIIHPGGAPDSEDPQGLDVNFNGPGPDPWLSYLWARAFTGCRPDGTSCSSDDENPANQAFVTGFLAHAAGDMYGHTFMNYFTGGPFHFKPTQENAIKHVVLEGYLDKRTPPLQSVHPYSSSIAAGVDAFIYRNMIDARPGSVVSDTLLTGDNKIFSLPYLFSQLRARLDGNIREFYATVADFDTQYQQKTASLEDCGPVNPFDSAYWKCQQRNAKKAKEAADILQSEVAYRAANGAQVVYQEHWRADIDDGLRALPAMSHDLAVALFFNPGGLDRARAEGIVDAYTKQHLLSMAGLPDAVGGTLVFIDEVLDALGIPQLKALLAEMKRDLLNYLLSQAFGITIDQIEEYLRNPELYFDAVLNDPLFNVEGTGRLISLAKFNQEQLHISDPGFANPQERYDYRTFPPAYNSVVMIKLAFMSQAGVNQLLSDLATRFPWTTGGPLSEPNAMLGYIQTLDGSNQWSVNAAQMALERNCFNYQRIFMRQTGEQRTPCSMFIPLPRPVFPPR